MSRAIVMITNTDMAGAGQLLSYRIVRYVSQMVL